MAKHTKKKLSRCIAKEIRSGRKRSQAAAICFSKQRKKKKR